MIDISYTLCNVANYLCVSVKTLSGILNKFKINENLLNLIFSFDSTANFNIAFSSLLRSHAPTYLSPMMLVIVAS